MSTSVPDLYIVGPRRLAVKAIVLWRILRDVVPLGRLWENRTADLLIPPLRLICPATDTLASGSVYTVLAGKQGELKLCWPRAQAAAME
jgi:hypothetical protein